MSQRCPPRAGRAGRRGGRARRPDYRAAAAAAVAALQRWYSPRTGRWRTTGWWNAANALTAVIGYTRCTGDQAYLGVIPATFRAAQRRYRGGHRGFINAFFDDNGWWALAWVAAYDLTRDRRYLEAAQAIFAHNQGGWDDTCGGGLWWNARTGGTRTRSPASCSWRSRRGWPSGCPVSASTGSTWTGRCGPGNGCATAA